MISIRHVSLAFRLPDGTRRAVFENVSMEVAASEHVYLVGPSGSGKTTLLRLLYMDLRPDRGIVQVGEYRSDTITEPEIPYLRRRLGVVFQDFQLLPDRSLYENVAFPLYVTGRQAQSIKSKALAALARVGLSHRQQRFPHEVSGGEQQRAVIARAIVNDPAVLLVDEPTGNLDPATSEEVMRLLLTLNAQGTAVVMATHDYHLVRTHPARLFALRNQKLAEVVPAELKGPGKR
jgi:cell division transport system ATP-binding protein